MKDRGGVNRKSPTNTYDNHQIIQRYRERVNVVGMWGMENLIILLKVHGLYTTASVLCFNTLKYFIYKHTKNSIFMYLIFNFHTLYNNSSSTAPKKKKAASCEFKYKRLYRNQENIFIFFLFKNRRHNLTMNKQF